MVDDNENKSSLELERIVFFTDAVMAIVATILVIDLRVPDLPINEIMTQLPTLLIDLIPKYMSYALSFLIIGSFWVRHHIMFSYVKRYNYRLIWLNIIFLLFVALIPFSTAVLGVSSFVSVAVILYSGIVAIAAGLYSIMWHYATSGHRLVDSDLSMSIIHKEQYRSLITVTSFTMAIPVALLDPRMSLVIWAVMPILFAVYSRIVNKRRT